MASPSCPIHLRPAEHYPDPATAEEWLRAVAPQTLQRLLSSYHCTNFCVYSRTFEADGALVDDVQKFISSTGKERRRNKFKFQNVSGQFVNFQYDRDSGLFCRKATDGTLWLIVAYAHTQLWQCDGTVAPSLGQWSPDRFVSQLEENLTGKHRPRNHWVRVPTPAGQPVRC